MVRKKTPQNIAIIIMKGMEEFGNKVVDHLFSFIEEGNKEDMIINHVEPRFVTGEGKAVLQNSVRGKDVFIISDVTNYSVKYMMRGLENHMSPDDHFMDIKRVVSACGGKSKKITVIMPYLYSGRQDRRNARESLDAAIILNELKNMGVDGIITFDAHNPAVENATPYDSFDNLMPTYQMIKAILSSGLYDIDNLAFVSPDLGAVKRNNEYAQYLNASFGTCYKIRDLNNTTNGNNQIKSHEYIGGDISGKSVFCCDDILATGSTLLSLGDILKDKGAKNTNFVVTFPLFTNGVEKFDEAYERGEFHRVFGANAVYRFPELLEKEWYIDVDLSKYLAYVIYAIHFQQSITDIIDPKQKISEFIAKKRK